MRPRVGLELFAHLLVDAVLPAGTFSVAGRAVGWDEHLDPTVCDRLDLPGVPVAGVTDDRLGLLGDPVPAQVSERLIEHRLQVPEVGSVDRDLGGEDDLLLGHGGLHVVGLAVRQPL